MKTRKYKDNQQRKLFATNESKIFLIQYYKKIKEKTYYSLSPNGYASLGAGVTTLVPDRISKILSSKSVNTFTPEQKSLQIAYYLVKSSNQNTFETFSSEHEMFEIKNKALQLCYSKKRKQQENKTRIQGRCIQSNRPRSVNRLLRLSRIRIRTLALEGKITGCTRST